MKGKIMSIEIETKLKRHSLVSYWGGNDNGMCLQVTSKYIDDVGIGAIQLTMVEAAVLASDLIEFVLKEAKRRQDLLREQMAQIKQIEKSVFHEICEIQLHDFDTPELVVKLIEAHCPKTRTMKEGGES